MAKTKVVSRDKGHYFEGSQPCSLCGCGKRTAKAKKSCTMHKYVVEIVYYLAFHDFWVRDDDYRKERNESEDVIEVTAFGISKRDAELAAMAKFDKANHYYRAYPFIKEKIGRNSWLKEWISRKEVAPPLSI